MRASTDKSAFLKGVASGAPFIVVLVPFAFLFGVVSAEAGLNAVETLLFALGVIAGAAQFTAVQLMQQHAPTAIVLISALAVNLRLAMYSASLTPHLGALPLRKRALAAYLLVDQSFACSISAYERHPEWSLQQKYLFFTGVCLPIVPFWAGATLAGSLLGQAIPESFALDFAVPVTFLAIIAPMLRTRAHVVAALAAVVTALLFAFLPYNLGLLVAGTAGMLAGARAELWLERRANPAESDT